MFFALALLFSLPTPAATDKIVVTATRSAEDAASIPFTVDTVTADRWEASGGDAETALATVPGLAFTTSGGPGQTKSLLLRGANSQHTLVLIDGIPVNDPLSPSRAFDFGQIPVSEIDHIEVLKGPQSVLYGGDALAGVVQIFTKKTGSRVRAEAGSYNTFDANVSSMGFRAGYAGTKGFSAADYRLGNPERDGYYAWNLGGSKDFAASDKFLMRLSAQYQDGRDDTDKNGGPGGDSWNTYARHQQFLVREENVVLLPAEAELTVAGNYASHHRTDNTNGNDFYNSELGKAEAILRKPLGPQRFTLGAEYADEGGTSSQTTGGRRDFHMGGFYLQDQAAIGERFDTVAGARLDLHSETATAETYRVGVGYWLVPAWLRAHGSIGTGFKAPSLYQTYSVYGSPGLRPEKSLGGEAGVDLAHGEWRTGLTWFTTTYRDLIDFNLATNRFFNQSRAITTGVEWSVAKDWFPVHLENALTYLRAYDPATGLVLLRRPRWSDTVTLGLERPKKYGADLQFRYVGDRVDSDPVLFTRQPMPAYYTLGANGYYGLSDGLRFTARAVNLLDRIYEETSGYGVPGLSVYAGIEAEL
jgi:vitamin B12 transporter